MEKKGHHKKSNKEDNAIEVKIEGKNQEKPAAESARAEEKKEPTPLEKLQAQLDEKTRESSEYFDKWLRLRAEMENFKKRMLKEKADHLKFGNEDLLKALLPILDNVNRAIDHGKNERENSPLLAGVEMIHKEFLDTLERFGVKPIRAAGEVFDPEKHEAISQEESDLETNRVVSAVQNGYFYHDRLLRPAKVIVSKGRPQAEKEPPA
ncbi:MAG: nucleotide exchange factor GrpE [Deltaproteobacteria bacterium]|nr:nucleotide exchange factor GrpE [Deltaproteobacteria bacterium]